MPPQPAKVMGKNYSINMENGRVTSVEVNGICYDSIADIPDLDDRQQLQTMSESMVASVEVNGIRYDSIADIPGLEDHQHRQTVSQSIHQTLSDTASELMSQSSDSVFQWNIQQTTQIGTTQSGETDLLPTLFLSLFGSIAGVMLAIAAYSGYQTTQVLAREQRTTGRVVTIDIRQSSSTSNDGQRRTGNPLHFPIVEFSIPNRGRQTTTLPGSWPPVYEKGDTVPIRYDPANPEDARPDGPGSDLIMWLVPLITGVLGVSFSGATLLAAWLFKCTSPARPTSL